MKLADPSALPRGPKRFMAYWIRDIAHGVDKRGLRALLPVRFLVCVGVGVAVGWTARNSFLATMSDRIAFYAGLLAVNAILLAVCWAAFAKIYEILATPDFGMWVKQNGLHGYYDFYVEYIQLAQAFAVGTALAALVITVLPLIATVDRLALGAAISTSLYAGWWASGCVRIMQELADHRHTFSERGASNVHNIAR